MEHRPLSSHLQRHGPIVVTLHPFVGLDHRRDHRESAQLVVFGGGDHRGKPLTLGKLVPLTVGRSRTEVEVHRVYLSHGCVE